MLVGVIGGSILVIGMRFDSILVDAADEKMRWRPACCCRCRFIYLMGGCSRIKVPEAKDHRLIKLGFT